MEAGGLIAWVGLVLAFAAGAVLIPEGWRNRVAALPFLAGAALLAVQWNALPGIKLLTSSLGMLLMVKLCALWARRGANKGSWVAPYLVPWPGVDPEPFQRKRPSADDEPRRFAAGWWRMWIGVLLFGAVVAFSPRLGAWLLGALIVMSGLLSVHLGFSYVLTALYRLARWPVSPLFDDPWKSHTLVDLWSRRWNRPFVEMNRILLLPTANRLFGRRWAWLVAFVGSGILHEMAISYPAGAGFGLPLLYFCIQAVAVALERRWAIKGGWWVSLVWLLPSPLLFTRPFLEGVIAPLAATMRTNVSLWIAGLGPQPFVIALGVFTLVPVAASLQVPGRLHWREEFAKLSGLNRNIVWVYGAYVLAMIVGLGAFMIAFSADVVAGQGAAVAIVGFGALFWIGRIVADALAFRPEDWPGGPSLAIARSGLNTLFLLLAIGYLSLFIAILSSG